MEYSSKMKKNQLLIHTTSRMNVQRIILSKKTNLTACKGSRSPHILLTSSKKSLKPEKSTTLLTPIREVRSQGKALPPKLEKNRESQLSRAETHEQTNLHGN